MEHQQTEDPMDEHLKHEIRTPRRRDTPAPLLAIGAAVLLLVLVGVAWFVIAGT